MYYIWTAAATYRFQRQFTGTGEMQAINIHSEMGILEYSILLHSFPYPHNTLPVVTLPSLTLTEDFIRFALTIHSQIVSMQ